MNIRKKFIQLLFETFLCLSLQAQLAVGLGAGINKNFFSTGTQGTAYTDKIAEWGIMFNIPATFHFNDRVFLQSGISLMQKNYSYSRTGSYSGIYTNLFNTYLQLPLMAGWQMGKQKIKGFVTAGVYGAYWLKAKTKGKIPDIFSAATELNDNGQLVEILQFADYIHEYTFNSHRDERIEFGLAYGTGCNYLMNIRNSLSLEINYFHSLIDQQKKYMTNQVARYNQTICLSLAYKFTFTR